MESFGGGDGSAWYSGRERCTLRGRGETGVCYLQKTAGRLQRELPRGCRLWGGELLCSSGRFRPLCLGDGPRLLQSATTTANQEVW